jgi:hypothetical protein
MPYFHEKAIRMNDMSKELKLNAKKNFPRKIFKNKIY